MGVEEPELDWLAKRVEELMQTAADSHGSIKMLSMASSNSLQSDQTAVLEVESE
jgi:hypothetical protein